MTSPTTETIPRPGAEVEATTPEMKELQASAGELAASLPSTLAATLDLACNDAETVFNPDPAHGGSRGLHAAPDGDMWLARTFDGTCVACLAGAVVLTGAALFHRLLSRSFIRVYVRGHSLFSAF